MGIGRRQYAGILAVPCADDILQHAEHSPLSLPRPVGHVQRGIVRGLRGGGGVGVDQTNLVIVLA